MIRLIVSDIDGCLTEGGISRFDLDFLKHLQEWNRSARENDHIPPITVCTGRPQPYVEAMVQAIDCFMPVICESGGVLYDFSTRTLLINPTFDVEMKKKYNLLYRHIGEQFLNGTRPIALEPGKFTEITIIPYHPLTVDALWNEADEFIQPYSVDFRISRTRTVINFSSHLIDKGVGIKWLSEQTGIGCADMAGFGDSDVDALFLKEVRFAGCPHNAIPEVKLICHFVSKFPTNRGFMEFLKKIGDTDD